MRSEPTRNAKRVGATGNSGGGTHTAYISGLDDRIQAAAPSCYITSWKRMLESIGPQDAEQTFQMVRNYLSEAISKLGAANRIEAARIARTKGWL